MQRFQIVTGQSACLVCCRGEFYIREFKKLRRRRRGERRLKNEFIFYLRISRHSEVIYFVYHSQNYHETESSTQR